MSKNQTLIGVLGKVFGLKGFQRFYSKSNFLLKIKLPVQVILKKKDEQNIKMTLENIRIHNSFYLVSFCENFIREDLKQFVGKSVYINSHDLPTLKNENEFYIDDLLGCEAIDEQEKKIGWCLKEVFSNPGNDIFVFATPSKKILVPFVSKHIGNINLDTRTIEIFNWKEWLKI